VTDQEAEYRAVDRADRRLNQHGEPSAGWDAERRRLDRHGERSAGRDGKQLG
jgi:hypothetical protein